MDTLRWTREKPTAPGTYWLREPQIAARVVEVRRNGSGVLLVDEIGCDYTDALSTYPDAEWLGPLTPPEGSP